MLNDLCDVAVKDAADLSKNNQEKFGQIRRDGLGASDSSVVLDVNPFPDNNEVEIIRQKLSKVPTATEIKIGNMVNVKKGSDLEPLILEKFSDKFNVAVNKPKDMFMLKSMPFLRINYDGLINVPLAPEIPVEVKFISKYGAKYYNFEKCIGTLDEDKLPPKPHSSEHITKRYVKAVAKQTGIPIYYYTQVQQQLMGTGAELAYLSGLWDDDWELYTWVVYKDEKVIEAIKLKGYALWQKISRLK